MTAILLHLKTFQTQSPMAKMSQRSTTNKSQLAKSMSQSSASSTITSDPSTTQSSSASIQSSSPASAGPLLSYHVPLSSGVTSSTLEMDEDYDNI